MPLAERAPLGVLSGEAHRYVLGQERSQGQRLGVSPLDSSLRAEGSAPAFEWLPKLGMNREPLGPAVELLVQRLQELRRERGLDLLPRPTQPNWALLSGNPSHAGLERLLDIHQALVGLGCFPVCLVLGDDACFDQGAGV